MKKSLSEEFSEKYLRLFPLISTCSLIFTLPRLVTSTSLFNIAGIAARFLGPLGSITLATAPLIFKYLYPWIRSSFESGTEKSQEDYKEALSMSNGSDRDVNNLKNQNLFKLIQKSDSSKRGTANRILDEIEARKMDENDLLGENIIRLRKGSDNRIFIFVPGFNSNPKKLIRRSKYFDHFESIISDSSFAVFVWDTEDFWLPGNWVRAMKNTIPYSSLLLHELNNCLQEYEQINIIGHSLGCKVILNMISKRWTLERLPEKISFLGAAVAQTEDLRTFKKYGTTLNNYYSRNDLILKWLYRYAENLEKPIGYFGASSNGSPIFDIDCSHIVKGHTKYFQHLKELLVN